MLVMGVVRVWNLKIPEARKMNAAADWRKTSRGKVDAVISGIRSGKGTGIVLKGTPCPECGYIIRSDSFPTQCIYCGSSL
jgi:rubrerythrin